MQATAPFSAPATPAPLQLKPGEIDIGVVIEDGHLENAYRVILLPGDAEDLTWEKAKAWAEQQGGDLPTRMELLLFYKTQREQFQRDAYWSNEPHADDDAFAWGQGFYWGDQSHWLKGIELRARAVRRVVI